MLTFATTATACTWPIPAAPVGCKKPSVRCNASLARAGGCPRGQSSRAQQGAKAAFMQVLEWYTIWRDHPERWVEGEESERGRIPKVWGQGDLLKQSSAGRARYERNSGILLQGLHNGVT
jgi:hypothetical protein